MLCPLVQFCLVQLPSRVRLFVTPWITARQASLSISHVHLFPTPMDCSLPGYSVHGDSPGKHTGVSCHALLQGIFLTQGSNPGIKPRSSTLWADSLPPKLPGKPMNTGVGSLFLLQGNFLIQEWNQSLPRCKWILYQLSFQGSPKICMGTQKTLNSQNNLQKKEQSWKYQAP